MAALVFVLALALTVTCAWGVEDRGLFSEEPVYMVTFTDKLHFWPDWGRSTIPGGSVEFSDVLGAWKVIVPANRSGFARISKEFAKGYVGVRVTSSFIMNTGRGFNAFELVDTVHGVAVRVTPSHVAVLGPGGEVISLYTLNKSLGDRVATVTATFIQGKGEVELSIHNDNLTLSLKLPEGYTGDIFARDFWIYYTATRDYPDSTDLSVAVYNVSVTPQTPFPYVEPDGFYYDIYPTQVNFHGVTVTALDAFWYIPTIWLYPLEEGFVYTQMSYYSVQVVEGKTVYSMSSTYTVYGNNASTCSLYTSTGVIEYRITEDFFTMHVKGRIVVKEPLNASMVYVEFGVSPQRPYLFKLMRGGETLTSYLYQITEEHKYYRVERGDVLYLKSLDEKFPNIAMVFEEFNGRSEAYAVLYDASHVRTIELHLWYPTSRQLLRPGEVFEVDYYVLITFTDYVPKGLEDVEMLLEGKPPTVAPLAKPMSPLQRSLLTLLVIIVALAAVVKLARRK